METNVPEDVLKLIATQNMRMLVLFGSANRSLKKWVSTFRLPASQVTAEDLKVVQIELIDDYSWDGYYSTTEGVLGTEAQVFSKFGDCTPAFQQGPIT
jgi:hypothetical protein